MPNADKTIRAVELNLARMHRYQDWTIGVCADPEPLEVDLEYPAFFRHWETDSEADARATKAYFLEKGMASAKDSGADPRYVYIY